MAAPTIAFDGTRINDAEAITNWTIGGAQGGLNIDNQIQNLGCIGSRVSSTTAADYYTSGTPYNLAAPDTRHYFVWLLCTTPAALDTLSNGGLRARLGSGAAAYAEHYVGGDGTQAADTYRGGWKKFAVSPRRTAEYSTGSPNLGAITIFGGTVKTVATARVANGFVDAIDLGNGLRLTAGDGTTPGTFARLQAWDEGNVLNKYGVIRSISGVFFLQGKVLIGDGATATLFSDKSQVVVFEDALVDTDFYELKTFASATLTLGELSSGVAQNGVTITAGGTKLWYLNAAAGTFNAYACTFGKARQVTLAAASTLRNCSFSQCGMIYPNGATMSGCTIAGSTATASMQLSAVAQANTLSNLTFLGNTRAIEITTPGTYQFNGIKFSGNGYDIRNNSNGLVTIEVIGNGDTPTFEDLGSSTHAVSNPKTHELTGIATGSEVTYVKQTDGTVVFHVESMDGTGHTTYPHNGDGTVVDILINHLNYIPYMIEGVVLGSSNQSLPVAQVPDVIYANP